MPANLNLIWKMQPNNVQVLPKTQRTMGSQRGNRTHPCAYNKDLYKAWHLIENFFAKLKQYRAIATPYDKYATNFQGAIYIAASVILLN